MAKTLTITLSDEDYEALQRAASRAHVSPEELATSTVAEQFPKQPEQPERSEQPEPPARTPEQSARDELLEIMRARGHLVDPSEYPPHPGASDIPPVGAPEREKFEQELDDEWARRSRGRASASSISSNAGSELPARKLSDLGRSPITIGSTRRSPRLA